MVVGDWFLVSFFEWLALDDPAFRVIFLFYSWLLADLPSGVTMPCNQAFKYKKLKTKYVLI